MKNKLAQMMERSKHLTKCLVKWPEKFIHFVPIHIKKGIYFKCGGNKINTVTTVVRLSEIGLKYDD